MALNPIESLAILSAIYTQNKNLLESYSNSIAIVIKSKLVSFSRTSHALADLINDFDDYSKEHCALDVNYSYSKPIDVSSSHIVLYEQPQCMISLANWSYLIVFTENKLNLINNLNGKIVDCMDLDDINQCSSFRIYVKFKPIATSNDVRRLRDMHGFIIEFNKSRVNYLGFDGTKRLVVSYSNSTEIAQLSLLSSGYLLIGTGKYNYDQRLRVLNGYHIICVANGEIAYKFKSTVTLIYVNLNDYEILVDDRSRKIYVIAINIDGQIDLFSFIASESSNKINLNHLCNIPTSGLNISNGRLSTVMIDRLCYYENLAKKRLNKRYDNVLIRFSIYYDSHDLCIFDAHSTDSRTSSSDDINQYRISKVKFEQKNETFGILYFYGNTIAFENGIYEISINRMTHALPSAFIIFFFLIFCFLYIYRRK